MLVDRFALNREGIRAEVCLHFQPRDRRGGGVFSIGDAGNTHCLRGTGDIFSNVTGVITTEGTGGQRFDEHRAGPRHCRSASLGCNRVIDFRGAAPAGGE